MNNYKEIIRSSAVILAVIIISLKFSFLYSINSIKPDLLLLILIRLSKKTPNPFRSVIFGFSAGLINDLLIGDVIGISSLSYSIVCFGVSYYRRGKGYLPSQKRFLIYFISVIFSAMIIYPVTLSGLGIAYNLTHIILPSILYTLLSALVLQIFRPVK